MADIIDTDDSVLDYGINEAEVNKAITTENVEALDVSDLPIEVDVENVDALASEDFARMRRNGFGGSDSSILLGVNPFTTLRELVIQKATPELTQQEKDIGKLSAVRKGNDLEPLIMAKAEGVLGFKIIKPPHMYKFKEFPYLKMNFDGVGDVAKTELIRGIPLGKYLPVEIKVATVKGQRHYNPFLAFYSESRALSEEQAFTEPITPLDIGALQTWSIEQKAHYYGIPQYYYTQIQQEMMALDAPYGFLAVLFDNDWQLHIYIIYKDEIVQNALKVEGFKAWNMVESYRQHPELNRTY